MIPTLRQMATDSLRSATLELRNARLYERADARLCERTQLIANEIRQRAAGYWIQREALIAAQAREAALRAFVRDVALPPNGEACGWCDALVPMHEADCRVAALLGGEA